MPSHLLLIIDDDSTILEIVSQVLLEEGYRVIMSSSGRAALDLARQQAPSLILLDLMMPEMNGWQVVDELKSSAETRGIPILLLSARRGMDVTARELGVASYLEKPFDIDELVGRVQQLLPEDTAA